MGLFDRLRGFKKTAVVQMATQVNDSFFAWNGKVYESDIVRACIAPRSKAVGKLLATHIRVQIDRDGRKNTKVNPDAYMRFLLEEPNPTMTGQKLQERMAAQLAVNGNAFALVTRDENDYPTAIYPIPCSQAEALYDKQGELFLRFCTVRGEVWTFPYRDIIHLTEDVAMDSIFGKSKMPALAPLMQIVTTTDQGIVAAVKNGGIVKWLLKFNTSTRDEDIKRATDNFAKQFLSVENGTGVAGINTNVEAQQLQPHDYVPQTGTMNNTQQRIYALFNTNTAIVTSAWSESDWAAYFEAEVEPVLIDMQNEFTRKLFSRRERAVGNKIIFDAAGIDSETTATKLAYASMVDRRAMTPNEWREKFHWAPLEGGDVPLFWQDPTGKGGSDE